MKLNIEIIIFFSALISILIAVAIVIYRIIKNEQKKRVLYFLRKNFDNYDLIDLQSTLFGHIFDFWGIPFQAKVKHKQTGEIKFIYISAHIFGDIETMD